MWAEAEIDALAANISLDYFWGDEITPKIFKKYIDAYNKRLKDEMLTRDINDHQLGAYIMAGLAQVMSGKKSYPETPQLVEKFEEMSTQQQQQPVRWYTKEETEQWLEKRRLEKAQRND